MQLRFHQHQGSSGSPYRLPSSHMSLCVQVVEDTYNLNPYHNAMHAADVTQSVMCMLAEDNLSAYLSSLELFCVIISCCIHDVGHFGVNNDFLVRTQHSEALVYNDVRYAHIVHHIWLARVFHMAVNYASLSASASSIYHGDGTMGAAFWPLPLASPASCTRSGSCADEHVRMHANAWSMLAMFHAACHDVLYHTARKASLGMLLLPAQMIRSRCHCAAFARSGSRPQQWLPVQRE